MDGNKEVIDQIQLVRFKKDPVEEYKRNQNQIQNSPISVGLSGSKAQKEECRFAMSDV